ncbi:MAG: MFS transporter, partial [Anaerolineales bacterium]|nr:MFS transporter [Anaerolineales bacterium]
MNLHQILRKLKPEPVPRAEGVSDRVVRLGLLARFFDELLSGLPDLLLPTIRDLLGLSYTQASLLWQITDYVAVVVEPLNGLFIDIWQRRWLLGLGAIFIGLAVMVMGVAPTFVLLAVGFFLYGIGSGPLAHTADVVLVESHPAAPDRIYARSTMIDTIGALLPPIMVAVTFWLELPWRSLLVVNGGLALIYAGFILRTRFPGPAGASPEDDEP